MSKVTFCPRFLCSSMELISRNKTSSQMWPLRHTDSTKQRVSKEVQTIIRVYPHILESNKVKAQISSEAKCQTEISIRPDLQDKMLYSMLEYINFNDIQESSQRIINLPRKVRLQFSSQMKLRLDEEFLLLDDDGVAELVLELKERSRKGGCRRSRTFLDKSVQTITPKCSTKKR